MALFPRSAGRSGVRNILAPVTNRNAPKITTIQAYRSRTVPSPMNAARNTSAPRMP